MDPKSIYEDYETELTDIRVNVKQLMGEKLNSTYSIISPLRKDGKSLIIYLLAMEYSAIGKKVLIMDFDIFAPKISYQFSASKLAGVQDYLLSDTAFGDIIHDTRIPNLHIMPLGQNPYNVKLLFDTEKVDELINRAKSEYDLVFIDTPALLISPEVNGLLGHIDNSIMVTRIGHTSRKNIEMVLEKLNRSNTHFLGAILSDIKPVPLGSYYDKYKKYRKYYYYEKNNMESVPRQKWKPGKAVITTVISLLLATSVVVSLLAISPGKEHEGKKQESEMLMTNSGPIPESHGETVPTIPGSDNEEISPAAINPASESVSTESKTEHISGVPQQATNTISEEKNETSEIKPGSYVIISGCFKDIQNAEDQVSELRKRGYNHSTMIGTINGLYSVSIDNYQDKEQAIVALESARSELSGSLWLYKIPK